MRVRDPSWRHEDLVAAIDYDPETGAFRWKVKAGSVRAGAPAGSLHCKGYIIIGFQGRQVLAQRVAWFYVHGQWPSGQLDHRDMDKQHNAIANLREASDSQNKANRPSNCLSASGIKGVTWHSLRKRWRARLKVGGREKYLGLFDTVEAASAAYREAATKTFGEFARF